MENFHPAPIQAGRLNQRANHIILRIAGSDDDARGSTLREGAPQNGRRFEGRSLAGILLGLKNVNTSLIDKKTAQWRFLHNATHFL
jgi:hypothetical protein